MIDTVFFDLDGTLLPMDHEAFVKAYLGLMTGFLEPYGYDPATLARTIWKGTGAMKDNDGSKTNEDVFWDVFRAQFGPRADTDRELFDEFYASRFGEARVACGFDERAAGLIGMLRSRGVRCVLATNPLFPRTATYQRIRWAGLDPKDFDLVTTYENSRFCKPNPEYFREILGKIGKEPGQCLMVGNDGREDTSAGALGMRVFLITDCLLNEDKIPEGTPRGSFGDMIAMLHAVTAAE